MQIARGADVENAHCTLGCPKDAIRKWRLQISVTLIYSFRRTQTLLYNYNTKELKRITRSERACQD